MPTYKTKSPGHNYNISIEWIGKNRDSIIKNSGRAIIGTSKRGESDSYKLLTPGPGAYNSGFSEFSGKV